MWLALEIIMQILSQAALHKKVLGVTASIGVTIGMASAGVIQQAKALDAELRDELKTEQALIWKNHNDRGDLILTNLNSTLGKIEQRLEKIDGRVYDMHEVIPINKRKHR